MNPSHSKGLSVKTVAEQLGISPHTLRAWEKRYGVVAPNRTVSGRRVYAPEEVERLQLLLELVNMGHSISRLSKLTRKDLEELTLNSKPSQSFEVNLTPLLTDLMRFDFESVYQCLEQFRLAHDARGFVLQVLSPLMGKVGELVAKGKFSIAQEHALSAIVRDQIAYTLTTRFQKRPAHVKACLLTTAGGELHEFGILLSAALFSFHGRHFHYLGPNLPVEPLIEAAKALKPSKIILGSTPQENGTDVSEDYLRALHAGLKPEIEVWIGGQGKLPHLRSIFGSRGYRVVGTLQELDNLIQ